ncbi:MAG: RodZ domain-containing protein [candidate division FCPU426 bacterium]
MNEALLEDWLVGLRKKAGLTPAQIEEMTKIPLRVLQAMERGEFDLLPTLVHARAFCVAYARACGADEAQIQARLASGFSAGGETAKVAPKVPKESATPRFAEWRRKAGEIVQRVLKLKAWIKVLAAVVLLLGLWLLLRPRPALNPEDQNSAGAGPAGAALSLSATAAAPVELSLRSRRTCWVVLEIDGKRLPTLTLEPNKRERFKVQSRAVMLAGNIGAVRVWWNGENIGYFGELGERMNGIVFEAGKAWRKDPSADLALPPGVPSKTSP